MYPKYCATLCFLALALCSTEVRAAETRFIDWGLCPTFDLPAPPEAPPGLGRDVTYLSADVVETRETRWHKLWGDVQVVRNDQWLRADEAEYDSLTGQVEGRGNVALGQLDLSIVGDRAQMDLEREHGRVDKARYWLVERHARGTTETITLEGSSVAKLHRAKFTTCPENSEAWTLKANRVRLDRDSGFGSATNVVVTFKQIPLLYAPYITFPIDDRRKTGFLIPNIGVSSSSGLELEAPYYLNLAPNYDATLTPRYMSDRGLLMDVEGRMLTRRSEGVITVGHLPNDQKYGDDLRNTAGGLVSNGDDPGSYDDDRTSASVKYLARPLAGVTTEISAGYLSDSRYLADFGNSLVSSATDHVERRLDLRYDIGRLNSRAQLLSFQTIDPDITPQGRPYRKLPEIAARYSTPPLRPWEFEVDSVFDRFDHAALTTGDRLDVTPELRFPYERAAGFLTPRVALRHTEYRTNELNGPATAKARTVPVASLDSGLFFERDLILRETELLQTLEPRVFYAYVPFEEQDDLPVYDTSEPTFGYAQLFRADRFIGADRVGDTNQITLALTSRLIESNTAVERIRGSIGQIYYLDDRQVQLPGELPATLGRSDLVAEAAARLSTTLRARADALWNPLKNEVDKASVRFQYRADRQHILNVSYRWTRETRSEQTDYSLFWPLSRRWIAMGRWLYAHRESRTMEALGGLQYTSCCWNLSVLSRRYYVARIGEHPEEYKDSIMVQLELKGLSNVGHSIDQLLRDSIYGFGIPDPSMR